jgi:filamentous hemagglutinin
LVLEQFNASINGAENRMRRSWVLLIAAVIAVFAALIGVAGLRNPNATAVPAILAADVGTTQTSVNWSHGHNGSTQNAEEHWRKHGANFPEFHSAEEYEHGALDFVRNLPPGTLTKHRSNGDTLFYNPNTNTFAVEDGNGRPRTFFRPDSGRAYWDRQ